MLVSPPSVAVPFFVLLGVEDGFLGRVSAVRVPLAPPADGSLAEPCEVLPCVLVGDVGDRLLFPLRVTPEAILPLPFRFIPSTELVLLLVDPPCCDITPPELVLPPFCCPVD